MLKGLVVTIQLSASAIVLGSLLGLGTAALRSNGPVWAQWLVRVYVEIFRNTPFLVQLYIVFFGLPSVGIRISAIEAGILAMTINLGAYSTEIFRAGIESVHRSQIEAGLALALTRWQIFTRVVLVPAVARVWPSLASQFILIMLTSSVCSFISVEEHGKNWEGNNSPIGKTIHLNESLPFKIQGVFKDLPANSHMEVDFIVSYATLITLTNPET
ncbi:MAG TPA: amino acid ABC transporter permease, partial [Devosia sp.]|nr:amino acid ABC transporter permease [Devosia sp.]